MCSPVFNGTGFIPISSPAVTPSPLGRLPFGKLGYPSSVFFGKAEKSTFPSGKAYPTGKFFSFSCAPFKFCGACFYLMFNGFPFNLHKNRRDGNGDIGEHKKRKSESIENLFNRGGVDLFPFGNGCYRADSEKGEIHIENAFQKGKGNRQKAFAGKNRKSGSKTVNQGAENRKHHRRHYVHCHIEAGKISPENSPDKVFSVFSENLEIAFCPADSLAPGLAEKNRLFVIKNGVFTKADFFAPGYVMNGEFDIFGQKVKRPAAAFFKDFAAEEKASSGDGAGISEKKSCSVEISAFPQEPKGISGGDPVIAVVF